MARVMVAGLCLGVEVEPREWQGNKWDETTIHVLTGVESTSVRVGQNYPREQLPSRGEVVAIEATVDAYVTKKGQVNSTLTAVKRLPALEEVLPADLAMVA